MNAGSSECWMALPMKSQCHPGVVVSPLYPWAIGNQCSLIAKMYTSTRAKKK